MTSSSLRSSTNCRLAATSRSGCSCSATRDFVHVLCYHTLLVVGVDSLRLLISQKRPQPPLRSLSQRINGRTDTALGNPSVRSTQSGQTKRTTRSINPVAAGERRRDLIIRIPRQLQQSDL